LENETYAILSELAKRARVKPVVVGGSAVELFTGGMYTTGDIDIVGDTQELSGILLSLGFEKKDRFFVKGKVFIDLVGTRLAGNYTEIKIKGTETTIGIISVEDLIIDRLCACKWWRSQTDCEQAKYLLGVYHDKVNKEYLDRRAEEEDVSEILVNIGPYPKSI
jgi:hypothetical protein